MIETRFDKNKVLSFDERVDPASTALVVIDVQNDFALPQGVCGQVGDDISPVAPMLGRLQTLISSARQSGVLIIFLRTIYDEVVLSHALAEQYRRRGYPNSICLSNTRGAELYTGFGPRDAPNEVLVTKHRYSAFWGSAVDLVLRRNAIRTLILTGIATEVCVESTARDAFFRDYQVVVPADCVGCYSEDRQKASLAVLARSFGLVTSAADIQAVWLRLGNGARNWQSDMVAKRALTTVQSRLMPVHTALVLLNLQADIYGDGPACSALRRTLPRIRSLLDAARNAGSLVIHARSAAVSARGCEGAPFVQGFEPQGDEQVVNCQRSSAFGDTQLDVLLRSNCMRTVALAGATTTVAVESTARECTDRDYHTIIAEDCVAAPDGEEDLHAASLATMRRHFADVMPAREIGACWKAVAAPVHASSTGLAR